ncbi:MAG: hypothetical protein ACREV6_17925 [Clostridium sp.]
MMLLVLKNHIIHLFLSVDCDEITTRGWVVNLETAKYEKVIL